MSLKLFHDQRGVARTSAIRLAVMDMWRALRKGTETHAPLAAILFDKFHVLRQLLSHRANLSAEKRRALHTLVAANKRLNTAYVLEEPFAQRWEYRSEV